jgi:hypothetical protein
VGEALVPEAGPSLSALPLEPGTKTEENGLSLGPGAVVALEFTDVFNFTAEDLTTSENFFLIGTAQEALS